MSDDDKFLAELLKETIAGIDIDEALPNLPILSPTICHPDRTLDASDDYNLVRTTLRNQLQYFDTATQSALISLIQSQHPRAVEAFASLMGQMTTTADKLLKQQKDMKEITNSKGGTQTKLGSGFVGTTNDLLDQYGDASDPKYVLDND